MTWRRQPVQKGPSPRMTGVGAARSRVQPAVREQKVDCREQPLTIMSSIGLTPCCRQHFFVPANRLRKLLLFIAKASADAVDAKGRIASGQCRIGKATRKSVRSECAVEDVHSALLEVSRKQERSGCVGVERDVGVRSFGRIIDHCDRLRSARYVPGGNRTVERTEEKQGSRRAARKIEAGTRAVVYGATRAPLHRRRSGCRYLDRRQRQYCNGASGGVDRHRATASLIDPDG